MVRKEKRPIEVRVERRMLPRDPNNAGNVFGGSILKYVEEIGSIAGEKHAGKRVVIASIDRMNFLEPVYIEDLLVLDAKIVYVGNTSMVVFVDVRAEDMRTGESRNTGSAYATYVALDDGGNPTTVPKLKLETDEERRKYEEAEYRRECLIEEAEKERGEKN